MGALWINLWVLSDNHFNCELDNVRKGGEMCPRKRHSGQSDPKYWWQFG